jgi:uncharacterized protein DUF6624
VIESEAKQGEVSAANVAMIFDRVRVHQGRQQRYGTQFEVKNGELMPDATEKLATVDSLRASVGLPPMAEYAKHLESIYHLPAVWPPVPPPRR